MDITVNELAQSLSHSLSNVGLDRNQREYLNRRITEAVAEFTEQQAIEFDAESFEETISL